MFKLVQEGTEQVNEVYVKTDDDWSKVNGSTIVMQDAPVLDIDKTDIAGNLLPGATLTIRNANDEIIDTWVTDYKTHRVPISDDFLKLSDDSKEYIYTLTEDAAPAGFKIANSVQFKLETVDDGISLFVRENADAEWVRADKRLIQMIDEATPREDTPTPSCSHTAADTRYNPGTHSCSHAGYYAAQGADPPADRRWFPAAGYCGRVPCVCDRYRAADR
ncbi:prealbumin-like fold domain-containing protein [Gemmiger formicilis]|nr:prealbumin-like fold domain-containing protein [Gemmiger formicilis]